MRPIEESIIGATGRSKTRLLNEESVVSVDLVIHLTQLRIGYIVVFQLSGPVIFCLWTDLLMAVCVRLGRSCSKRAT